MRLTTPRKAPDLDLVGIRGNRVRLSDYRGRRVMLSFFRDASCPFCNLRAYELSRDYSILKAEGLEIIAFFQSSAEHILRYMARYPRPFIIVDDEKMEVYKRYGIEHSLLGMMRGLVLRLPRMLQAMQKGFLPHLRGNQTLLPADFLIDEDGVIRVAYYGRDIGDHIPMDKIHAFVKAGRIPENVVAYTHDRA